MVRQSFNDMYEQYVTLLNEKSQETNLSSKVKSSIVPIFIKLSRWSMFISHARQQEVVPTMKYKMEVYLDKPMYKS